MFGQRAFEARRRGVFQPFERLDLLIQIASGRVAADDLRNSQMNGLRWISRDARLGAVEEIPSALARLDSVTSLNVNEWRFAPEIFDIGFRVDAGFEPQSQGGVPITQHQRMSQ